MFEPRIVRRTLLIKIIEWLAAPELLRLFAFAGCRGQLRTTYQGQHGRACFKITMKNKYPMFEFHGDYGNATTLQTLA
jgi:hypothetical protein